MSRSMKFAFSKQRLILVFSFILTLSSLIIAEHIHVAADTEVNCELCIHGGSDAALCVPQDYLSLTVPQIIQAMSALSVIFSVHLHKHPRGPPLLS